MAQDGPRGETKDKQYFFPDESPNDNLVFTKFARPAKPAASWAYLAGTCHNVFRDIFSPSAAPERKETFRLFSAMMIYRHAVELLLKAIIIDVCKTTPRPVGHSLKKLFNRIRTRRDVKVTLGKDLEFVQTAIAELHSADDSSEGFRYATDHKGKPYFPDMPKTVDGKRLFENCEKLWDALWRVHGPVGS